MQLRDTLAELGLEETDITIEDDEETPPDAAEAPVKRTSSVPLAVLRGGVRSEYLEQVRKKGARVVLTTYGYSRRGVSLPRMTAIVLASPRRNGLMQILGRITRKGDDMTIVRQVVDIVDVNTMYRGQFYDRKEAYKLRDWPVSVVSARGPSRTSPGDESD
jgi:hypothetical protein